MLLHGIDIADVMTELGALYKLNADWDNLTHLMKVGCERADAWIKKNFDRLGEESTGPNEAMILESLTQALRAPAFPVPSALGVQEGGFTVLGALFAVPHQAALALSFVKRVPDLAIGLRGLLAWYWLEMHQLLPIPAEVRPLGSPPPRVASPADGLQPVGGAFTRKTDDQRG